MTPASGSRTGSGTWQWKWKGPRSRVRVHPADIQDRDGATDVIIEMLKKAARLWAGGGYRGKGLRSKLAELGVPDALEIVEKTGNIKGFSVLCRR